MMMMLRIFIVILLIIPAELLSLRDQRRQIIGHVRQYLKKPASVRTYDETNWMENSNKIGFGYNVLAGSPICYTGACQMDEFTRSIFKLNYTSAVIGSCMNRLIPK